MAARRSSSSSEDVLSDESGANEVNFYGSDIGNGNETLEDSGPLPYRFEPRRRQREQHEESEESEDSETDRLGNNDWYLLHFVIYLQFRCISEKLHNKSLKRTFNFILFWPIILFWPVDLKR